MTGQPTPSPDAAAPRGRTYPITELAEMTGWHRDTIADLLRRKDNPLPYEARGRQRASSRLRCGGWREDVATQES
ncbi:hypothetical protein GOFOIKOB_4504 [Methylobacterium tardum]|uniref:Uncharacterized protein n=1 Tax=Methylobacterium tardum TaxID=374432 RepID=A0AA37WUX3_9HYPH|nr:hypothetical protein GOFOIKOB_4504 [Methylobacterium tardum]GLS73659.1 hypothetical protein GCM10007890_56740 [Methylobacterium tardum]